MSVLKMVRRPMSVSESEAKRADACIHCRMADAKLGQALTLVWLMTHALRQVSPSHPLLSDVAAYLEANDA
jgi:hypothetical protein